MSAAQNGYPVHARKYLIGDGRVRTECGVVVPDAQATADCGAISCRRPACLAVLMEGSERRRLFHKVAAKESLADSEVI